MRLYELLESLDKDQKRVGQVGAAEKARKIGPVLGREPKQHPFKGRLVGEDTVQEVAPPGMEDWIKNRKADFKKRYGDRWQEVLYATAWKRKKNENLDQGVVEDVNTGPQIIYATGPRTMGINDVDLVFKDLRTGRIVAHVVGNNYHPGDDRLQEFAPSDRGNGGGGDDNQPKTARYEIRMNNSKQPTYLALGDPQQDSKHEVYKLVSGKTDGPTYYGMGMTLVSNLDWWSFLEKMLGDIMWEDDAIEAGLVDRKDNGDLVFLNKQQGMAEAAGLYGPFTVTINTGERPQSRTKTKKFRREDDAILWAQDWLDDFPQYSFATAQVTDPEGNVVWTTDEQGVAEGSLKEFSPAGGEGGNNYGGDLYDILMGFISERYPDLFDYFGSDVVDSTVSNMVVMGSFGDIDPSSEDDLEDAVSQILVQLEDDALGESKGELWRVLEPRNIGGHAARYYIVKGQGKDLKIWRSKSGAGDFIKQADAEAKAAELNKGVAEQTFQGDMMRQIYDKYRKPASPAEIRQVFKFLLNQYNEMSGEPEDWENDLYAVKDSIAKLKQLGNKASYFDLADALYSYDTEFREMMIDFSEEELDPELVDTLLNDVFFGAKQKIGVADMGNYKIDLGKPGVAEAMPMTSLTSRYVDDPKNPAFAAKQPTGKDPLDSLSGIVALRKTDPKRAFRALQDYGFRNPNDPVIVAASKIGNQVKQDLLQKKGITNPMPWDTTDEMSAMIQKSIFDYIEKNLSKTGVAEDAEPIDREFHLVKKLGRLGQRIVQNPKLWEKYTEAIDSNNLDWIISLIQEGTGADKTEIMKLAKLFSEIAGGLGRLVDFAWSVKEGTWEKDFMNPYRQHRSRGVLEGKKKSEPEADYGPEYQEMVARVKKLAGLGPLKTVWDPVKRVYKNVPVNQKPAEK